MARPLMRRRVATPSRLGPIADKLAALVGPGSIVSLQGPLGAGKTTLVRAVCKRLDVDPGQVRSPSYTLVNEYQGRWPIYHIDLFRLADDFELYGLGLDELLEGQGVCFLEWPDRAEPRLDPQRLFVVRMGFIKGSPTRLVEVFAPPRS